MLAGHGFLGVSPEEYQRGANLAKEALTLAKNTLLIHLRFLDSAVNRLENVLHAELSFATDGSALYFEPFTVLRRYRAEPAALTRDYLHVLLHCLLRHMYLHTQADPACWDLACDISVESIISGLGLPSLDAARSERQAPILSELRGSVKPFTAEKLYRHFRKLGLSPGQLRELRDAFRADDHGLWYQQEGFSPDGPCSQSRQSWEELSRHVQADLETFSRGRGQDAGALLQNLTAVNRETYDYAAFLRKFAARSEVMQVDDDEFDYIFYTYGLKLYGKMPLVEPLEYKEIKKIREFVIAIDTSGSVSGPLVQAFVQKTYNILKSAESFATRIHLRIIQCDQTIQEDAVITSQAEFDQYLQTMTLKGFGGTDFRPVFAHVEALKKAGAFRNLKGLIYFTDGLGIYPERKPDYETAFVFLDDDYRELNVPPWAIRLVLTSDDVEGGNP